MRLGANMQMLPNGAGSRLHGAAKRSNFYRISKCKVKVPGRTHTLFIRFNKFKISITSSNIPQDILAYELRAYCDNSIDSDDHKRLIS